MEILGLIGIILGVIAIIYLALKGINMIIAAPLATFIVILLNNMEIINSIFGEGSHSYMGALSNYISNFFFIFLLGAILAKMMEVSGATTSIANFILSKIGSDKPYRVLLAIFIISSVLTYGGISLFVVMFAVLPLAKSLFQKINLPWTLIQTPLWLGISTYTMTTLPGTTALQNIIPINFLNTSMIAAPLPGILGSIGCVTFGLIYMKHNLNKSLANGEVFSNQLNHGEEITDTPITPSFFTSIFPIVALILIALIGSIAGNDFIKKNIIYIAMIIGIILSLLLFNKFIPDKIAVVNLGALGSVMPIFSVASAIAFGSVSVSTPSFEVFAKYVFNSPGGPTISLVMLTTIMSGITGSSSGALGIIMPNFSEYFLATDMHPEMIHRVATVSSNLLTVAPQSGSLITFFTLSGLNYKNGFKQTFITVAGSSSVALIIVIITGGILY